MIRKYKIIENISALVSLLEESVRNRNSEGGYELPTCPGKHLFQFENLGCCPVRRFTKSFSASERLLHVFEYMYDVIQMTQARSLIRVGPRSPVRLRAG